VSTVNVVDVPDRDRFEITVDDAPAGFAQYIRRGGRIVFVHTEIDPAFEGQGLGSKLAAGALDAVKAAGEPVVPLCPFIARFIERHPEYADLVDHGVLGAFDR
jgi:predicted GNAT family acetyltransferase